MVALVIGLLCTGAAIGYFIACCMFSASEHSRCGVIDDESVYQQPGNGRNPAAASPQDGGRPHD